LSHCSDLAKRDFEEFTFEKIDPELNVLLPFSSGTTGVPKV
jgi:acyl-coenzyme A synthetase/AMP-(fatty) acid ligase